ncbi:receptor-activated Ca2+-permeable cation channel [Polychaeton citri CBS 116435]|uniref:Receptor-activated Ca2+-permeable cation channel n=1 Tax=Polychaeton citri CBS 116435 TaxID=1314669 RepID=A0A9P4QE20_9PEZI|nr:receptor-activated Ca2+-permeable cation channel [Polychaeton citri CBS 116435]
MVHWAKLFGLDGRDRRGIHDELRHLLPSHRDETIPSAIPAREVTFVALRLKYQIEQVIPCELPEERITQSHSNVITDNVIKTAKSAGKVSGSEDDWGGCVVYCLLICKHWFKRQALLELWDADLHELRAVACEKIAKLIIEDEEDVHYLMEEMLLKRYSIVVNGQDTKPVNAIEKAVDLHAVLVIGSSGYQKCINHLWRGWLVQDDEDPSRFIDYKEKTATDFWTHFDPDRMRVPMYQNIVQIIFSLVYLGLYTGAINTINREGDLDIVEGLLYLFTLGFMCDELSKLWKVGRYYIGFWNVFNSTLYALLTVSFITRMVALTHHHGTAERESMNILSYNWLAFTAPMFWMRILLYLDTFRFFGAMLVVLKVMMKESLIFFALLILVLIGFFQAFLGFDLTDHKISATRFIIKQMINAIMGSPEFDGWDDFAPPFGLVLYYIYNFIVIVILLNVLIALYNSAYEDITGNSIDEYMALFSQKTMQFVRAPDENVYIAPLNLIELFLVSLPFEWWLPNHTYERLNDYVMGTIYSPLLVCTALWECRVARSVKFNRTRHEEDDDTIEEWEQLSDDADFESTGWAKRVESTTPNVVVDAATIQLGKVREELKELKEMIASLQASSSVNGST